MAQQGPSAWDEEDFGPEADKGKYGELKNQLKWDKDDESYDSRETNYLGEATKCGLALTAVQAVRSGGSKINMTESLKFSAYDAIYNRYVERKDSKLFGFKLPKLDEYIDNDDSDSNEITLVVQKIIYVSLMCYAGKKILGGTYSKREIMDYALAYAIRHMAGVLDEKKSS